ncbi:MAG: hypothetical protein JWR80_1604 [Bradyrhizobium sp.]|nr:hypothetical protein [Bradyrhizobium sp.]
MDVTEADQTAAAGDPVEWFVRELAALGPQLWRFTPLTATRMGVSNPETGPGTYFAAAPGEDIWQCIERQTGWLHAAGQDGRFVKLDLAPGSYHPRMARPIAMMGDDKLWLPDAEAQRSHIAGAQSQLVSLTHQLEAICRVVEPSPATLHVHGHEIRNLILLAATEAEMHWRGVLRANGMLRDRYSTNDYVAIATPLRLGDYAIAFDRFPELQEVRPFAGWDPAAPTASLAWYAAYNAIKHDREQAFAHATLGHAFAAISACTILLVAQFGETALGTELRGTYDVRVPDWPLPSRYVMPQDQQGWAARPHPDLEVRA